MVYEGSNTSFDVTNNTNGVYYYRVIAYGYTGSSSWSNAQSTTVLPPDTPILYEINNEDGDGNYDIGWVSIP